MSSVGEFLRARSGPMTSELVLRPGEFGLGKVPERLLPAATTTSVCGFCSTGCGLKVHLNASGEAINLTADPDYPVNLGMACPKGWEALTPLAAPDRATTPLRRNDRGELEPISWADAMARFVQRMRGIEARHGAAALSFLSTGQIVTEEMALLGALAKFGMGMRDVDSNTRQCMATSHVAYKQAFGFDAPPFTYADFEESYALIFIGANPCIAHPIMWQRVRMNRRHPDIVVVDPRRTETAMSATLHVPLRPKSDLELLYGLAHLLIKNRAVDQAFVAASTGGFHAFAEFVEAFTPERTVAATGISRTMLDQLVRIIAGKRRVSFWWTMGVNQSHEGTRTAQAIINLALMTGNIGRAGTGPNSITGQCNAMGSRLFGNATSLLGGHDFGNPEHRAKVAGVLGIDVGLIPDRPSCAYDEILDAIDGGRIRGLWIIGTNPAHSWIDHGRLEALRKKLEFLVVQDLYATTETARHADLVLPAAGWGEKDGVFINSERRIGVARKVARAPGAALSDFSIFKLVAEAWGCGEMFRAWRSPEAAFQILKELSREQPCDFSGVRDYEHLAAEHGIQWPWRTEARPTSAAADELGTARARGDAAHAKSAAAPSAEPVSTSDIVRGTDTPPSAPCDTADGLATGASIDARVPSPARHRRLFADGRFFTPDGRARFLFDPPRPAPEMPDAEFPFVLLTGRGSSAQWHTRSRTDKSAVLRKLAPTELYAEIHPADARRLRCANGDRVTVRSRRGAVEAVAFVTPTVQRGHVFLPMHFPEVNRLTFPAFDPHSRQPSYKAAAVSVERSRL